MRPRSLTDRTLLLVDDEEANLDLLEEFLRPDDYAALVRVSDARDAIALFETWTPDLVLLDLHMPHLSGFDVLSAIRQQTQPDDFIPILVLTADASAESRARALSEGAHDFLTKPLDALEVRLRVRNLLRIRMLHAEQRTAREAAEAATRAREQVLSFVAHDLRNPLTSIAMDAEMMRHLLSEEANPAPYRTTCRIERTAQRMHELIEDLLEVTRLEQGTFAVQPAPVAPHIVFAEAESMLQPVARRRGIVLSFEGPVDLPFVSADAPRLIQVLSNLAGNGMQFTEVGGTVRVSWRAEEGELAVSVADSGEGIAPDQLPHVFDAFWQGKASRGKGGLGIGLVITRAIVEAHGGRIWIESTPGIGSTAHFTIPFAPVRLPDSASGAESPAAASLHPI